MMRVELALVSCSMEFVKLADSVKWKNFRLSSVNQAIERSS